MPRYYFDVLDDGRLSVDTEGTDLADPEAARLEATQALAEMARDVLPGARTKHLTMTVREDKNRRRFLLDLVFTVIQS